MTSFHPRSGSHGSDDVVSTVVWSPYLLFLRPTSSGAASGSNGPRSHAVKWGPSLGVSRARATTTITESLEDTEASRKNEATARVRSGACGKRWCWAASFDFEGSVIVIMVMVLVFVWVSIFGRSEDSAVNFERRKRIPESFFRRKTRMSRRLRKRKDGARGACCLRGPGDCPS